MTKAKAKTADAYEKGDRVTHVIFGDGTVLWVLQGVLCVKFDKHGEKQLLEAFMGSRLSKIKKP